MLGAQSAGWMGRPGGGLCPSLSDSATVAGFLFLSTCAISVSGFVRRKGCEPENGLCQSGFSLADADSGPGWRGTVFEKQR